jgi:hypothetical protein
MTEMSLSPAPAVTASSYVAPISVKAPLRFLAIHSAVGNAADSILEVTAGSTLYVEEADWNTGSEWTWARDAAGREGYVGNLNLRRTN